MVSKARFDSNRLYFIPLGGSGEIGMNLNVYAFGGKLLVVDVGVTFEDEPGVDVVMADISWLASQKKHIAGIVITHAHEDHIGAAGHLWEQLKAPFYATPFTAGFLAHKLKECKVKAPVHIVPTDGHEQIGPFGVGFIRLTHSIPEPSGLAIQTEAGTVVHTGDWKIDPKPVLGQKTNEEALESLGKSGVLAMVCDSTCVFEKGWSGSEQQVQDFMVSHLPSYQKGRIVVACFASNVARLLTCYKAAQACGRRVVLAGRSLDRIDRIAREVGYFDDVPAFLRDSEGANLPPEKVLIVATGSQGEERAALVRMAYDNHPKLKLQQGDTVLFSSRVIPGNEVGIFAVQNQLARKGVRVVTPKDFPDMHVSGHPSRDELDQMYKWIKPKIAVPVHGEYRHLKEHAAFAVARGSKSVVPENGDVIVLDPKSGPKKVGQVPSGRVGVDGNRLLPMDGDVLPERKMLKDAGVVSVAISAQKGLSVSIRGLGVAEGPERDELVDDLSSAIKRLVGHGASSVRGSDANLERAIQKEVRSTVNNILGKKPIVLVHLLDMD